MEKEDFLSKVFLKQFKDSSEFGSFIDEIYKRGIEAMREFLWSEEMADACVFLMEKVNFTDVILNVAQRNEGTLPTNNEILRDAQDDKREWVNEIRNTHINIGTGKEISIKNLAKLVKEKVGFQGELYFNTDKPDGTMRKLTDVSKLHNLGWHHKIDIEEGVERMYRWYVK